MKNVLTILFAFCLCVVSAQDILIEETSIEVQEDTLYFLKKLTVTDNGTSFPDTSITRSLLGDSTQAAFFVFKSAIEQQQEIAVSIGKAFQRGATLGSFNEYRDLFLQVTGGEMYNQISSDYADSYIGMYRVFEQDGSNYFAELVQLANGRYRLRELDGPNGSWTGEQWAINPLSSQNFSLLNYNGMTYYFFADARPGLSNIFWPAQRVSGETGVFRIVKLR